MLPARRQPADLAEAQVVLGVACPDRSGRVTERGLLRALHWAAGHRIDIRTHHGMLIIGSASMGQHVVGSRKELPLPVTARQMCGIVAGQPLLLAALVTQDLLVIHPASAVARRMPDVHAQAIGAHHGG